ncbi:hypothetical protein GCM10009613_48160 [Pseudonocardia kongjuensis]|uniref:Serine hydrolase n=1 Tax=Pseudonocardia kongjuensis TaxID=102227 RepID=A0ABN1Y363_9PSEU
MPGRRLYRWAGALVAVVAVTAPAALGAGTAPAGSAPAGPSAVAAASPDPEQPAPGPAPAPAQAVVPAPAPASGPGRAADVPGPVPSAVAIAPRPSSGAPGTGPAVAGPGPAGPYLPEPQADGAPVPDGAPAADGGEPPAGGGEPAAGGGEPAAGGGEPAAAGGEPAGDTAAADPVVPPAGPLDAQPESAASLLYGTTRDLLLAMIEPGADAGIAPREAVTLPPGTIPVAREDEEGLQLSWALLDTATGRWTGSADADSTRTEAESTIKAWLAADTLRAAAEAGRPVTEAERADISASVRASSNSAAERLYRRGGREATTDRLAAECGVSVTTSRPGWWSFTQLSALDAAAILACVRDRAEEWPGGTELLTDLASITPDGRSGIHGMLPGAVAEKNGWTRHGAGYWNVNCVLAWENRALAVLTTYPAERDVEFGWAACRDVASDVLAADGVTVAPDVLAADDGTAAPDTLTGNG